MKFTVYILECRDKTLYIGSTNDMEKRLHAHNHLLSGAKYTRGRRPVRVVYKEIFMTLARARKREAELKRLTRSEKLLLISSPRRRR